MGTVFDTFKYCFICLGNYFQKENEQKLHQEVKKVVKSQINKLISPKHASPVKINESYHSHDEHYIDSMKKGRLKIKCCDDINNEFD